MSSLALYGRALRVPQIAPLMTLGLVARIPLGSATLALVLFLREETGSFATAGGVTAVVALTAGLTAPLQGRAIDRLSQGRVLVPVAALSAAGLVALIVLGLSDAPVGALVAAAVPAGAFPAISACLRPLMLELLEHDEELVRAGYALDAISIELIFIIGPLLTALLVAVASPAAALAVSAAITLAGTVGFAALPASRRWRGQPSDGRRAGALTSPGVRTLALAGLPIGLCFGTLEVTLPAFADEHGDTGFSGVLFAVLSVGSLAGGLAYGAAAPRLGTLSRGYLLLLAALPASLALMVLPRSVAVMLLLVPLAGCVIAPLTAAENQIASLVAPRGTVTEAYSWLIMATVVGVAAGNAAAGAIVEAAGWREALLAACGAAALGAALAIARRRTLAPAVAVGGR